MWKFVARIWNFISNFTQAWSIWNWLVGPVVVSTLTATLATYASVPWYLVIFYASAVLCFLAVVVCAVIISIIKFDEAKSRFNPQDKLRFVPTHWFLKTKGNPQYLAEMQIGLTVINTATFPIVYKVLSLRSTFDTTHIASHNFPWADYRLLGMDNATARDQTIKFTNRKKLKSYDGLLEYKIQYWKEGESRKFTKEEKFVLDFRMDSPNSDMISRPI